MNKNKFHEMKMKINLNIFWYVIRQTHWYILWNKEMNGNLFAIFKVILHNNVNEYLIISLPPEFHYKTIELASHLFFLSKTCQVCTFSNKIKSMKWQMSTFETTRNELRMPKKSCAQNSNYKQFLTCVRCDAMLETGK